MKEEYKALINNRIWGLVPRKPGMKVIGCKWVYKVKYQPDRTVAR